MLNKLDMRNNLVVASRFLSGKLKKIYWQDWRLRYQALADHAGNGLAARKGLMSARIWSLRERMKGRTPLSAEALENIFGFRRQTEVIGEWARRNSVWRVVIADFSKNIWATYNACHSNGLQIRCVADENPAYAGIEYRGLPIVPARRPLKAAASTGS